MLKEVWVCFFFFINYDVLSVNKHDMIIKTRLSALFFPLLLSLEMSSCEGSRGRKHIYSLILCTTSAAEFPLKSKDIQKSSGVNLALKNLINRKCVITSSSSLITCVYCFHSERTCQVDFDIHTEIFHIQALEQSGPVIVPYHSISAFHFQTAQSLLQLSGPSSVQSALKRQAPSLISVYS